MTSGSVRLKLVLFAAAALSVGAQWTQSTKSVIAGTNTHFARQLPEKLRDGTYALTNRFSEPPFYSFNVYMLTYARIHVA
jgi:hypothetical protein